MRKKTNTLISIMTLSMILFVALSIEATSLSPYGRYKANQEEQLQNEWPRERIRESRAIQPDGTIITFELVLGGEYNPGIMYRKNGYTIIDDDSKTWCWVTRAENGRLVSTGFPVHLYDPEELGLEKNLKPTKERAEELRDIMRRHNPNWRFSK